MNEINHICRLIKTNGYHGDFGLQMKFGEIVEVDFSIDECHIGNIRISFVKNWIQAYGNGQVEKLSDVLAVARKNGFINYNLKDFLQQDRDEDIAIRLVKMPV